jgi:hypothetical protein
LEDDRDEVYGPFKLVCGPSLKLYIDGSLGKVVEGKDAALWGGHGL